MSHRIVVALATLIAGCCVGSSSEVTTAPAPEAPRAEVAAVPEPAAPSTAPDVLAPDSSRITTGDPTLLPDGWRVQSEEPDGVDAPGDEGLRSLERIAALHDGVAPLFVHERRLELESDTTRQWTTLFYVWETPEQASLFADARRLQDETQTETHDAITDSSYLVVDRTAIVVSNARGPELARRLESLGFVLARENHGSGIAPPSE